MFEIEASLDLSTKITTYLILILSSALGLLFAFKTVSYLRKRLIGKGLLFITLLLSLSIVVVVSYLFSIKGYIISNKTLIINRPSYNLEIDLNKIDSISLLADDIDIGARSMGVGGFFGYYGKFKNQAFGEYSLYATRLNNLVAIHTEDGIIVVSPNDPTTLMEKVMEK